MENFSTDKPEYSDGEFIKISGTVKYNPEIPSIILQIINPDESGLVNIAEISPYADGSFSTVIKVGGPTWSSSGIYTIKISYGGNLEKSINYVKSSGASDDVSKNSLSIKSSIVNADKQNLANFLFHENPKLRILGFPSLDNSPQYYIDRYNNESEYQIWFDSQFPDYSIMDVVGYKSTHISNFPSLDRSPQYYIDRYNNESEYQIWFDSQFPDRTIYDVLGFTTYIPDWIKDYARLWYVGDISDSEFIQGLEFMLKNKIIVTPNFSDSENDFIDNVPSWFQYNALWWADDLISQHEFLNSLKYLIEKEIIVIE